MSSPAEGVKDLLIAAGVVAVSGSGWQVRVGRITESSDKMVAVYDSGGQNPNPKYLLNFVTVQAVIRGDIDAYGAAYTKAAEVRDSILGLEAQDVNGDRWDGVTGIGDIAFIGYDEKNRPKFSVNFRILLEPASNALTNRDSL